MLVRAQQTYTDANTGEVVDESEWEPRIRIMRGAGAYLAVFLEGTTDGSYDLTTGMEQPRKDTSLDPSYRFTTYCQPERYIGEHDD